MSNLQSLQKGWFCMNRGWQDDSVFKKEPYTERDAWIWLMEEAAFLGHQKNINGKPLHIMRGQLSHSLRFIADKWDWTPSKVDRFLRKLKKWNRINLQTETGQCVVTICNYDDLQFEVEESETPAQRPSKHGQNSSDAKNKESKKGESIKKEIPPLEDSGNVVPFQSPVSQDTKPHVPLEPWMEKVVRSLGVQYVQMWLAEASLIGDTLYFENPCKKKWVQEREEISVRKALGLPRIQFKLKSDLCDQSEQGLVEEERLEEKSQ